MKVICIRNGKEFKRDPEDLDLISIDIIVDYLREIEHLEKNPLAKLTIDYSNPLNPSYNLENCGCKFSNMFNKYVKSTQYASI